MQEDAVPLEARLLDVLRCEPGEVETIIAEAPVRIGFAYAAYAATHLEPGECEAMLKLTVASFAEAVLNFARMQDQRARAAMQPGGTA